MKLLDFGISQRAEGWTRHREKPVLAFTPRYASPEQLRGDPVDERSDIYQLGMLLADLVGEESPAGLRALIARATADEPARRPASAAELGEEALAVARETSAPRATGWQRPARTGVVLLALGGGGWLWWQGRAANPPEPALLVSLEHALTLQASGDVAQWDREAQNAEDYCARLLTRLASERSYRALRVLGFCRQQLAEVAWSPTYSNRGDIDAARIHFERALADLQGAASLAPAGEKPGLASVLVAHSLSLAEIEMETGDGLRGVARAVRELQKPGDRGTESPEVAAGFDRLADLVGAKTRWPGPGEALWRALEQEALRRYEKAAALPGRPNPHVLRQLGRIRQSRDGELEEGRRQLRAAHATLAAAPPPGLGPRQLTLASVETELAHGYQRQGDLTRALELRERAVSRVEAVYERSGRHVALQAGRALVHFHRAWTLRALRRGPEAETALPQARQAGAAYAEQAAAAALVLDLLAQQLLVAGRIQEAAGYAELAVRKSMRHSPPLLMTLAAVYDQAGNQQDARRVRAEGAARFAEIDPVVQELLDRRTR